MEYLQIVPFGKDRVGFPSRVRVAAETGEPSLDIDSVHEWVIQQACQEARGEAKSVKIRPSSEGVSIELPVTTSVLASFFAFTTLVLLGVTGYLLKLLRFERSRNRGSDEAPVPPGPTGLAQPDGGPRAVEQQQQQQQLQEPAPPQHLPVRPAPPPPPQQLLGLVRPFRRLAINFRPPSPSTIIEGVCDTTI